jgi:lipopolysaccharide/colanic/teichoic acid biosynthesis glycosyltransferase
MIKRLFDIIFSIIGIIIASPIILLIALFIKNEDGGAVFYRGQRVGKEGRIFRMFKFRSMVLNADKIGGPSTSADDFRLTKIGKFIRNHNLDELPQFFDILRGTMSFVGPRPEVPSEVETYPEDVKRIILSVSPGLTDLATLEDVHEEEILKGAADPHEAYRRLIKPKKIKLAVEYVQNRSFSSDIKILIKTALKALF